MPELGINSETVCFLINKAREFQGKEEVTIPETPSSPSDDWARQILADHVDDACLQEFAAAIEDLEPDQKMTLIALMRVGRGDYTTDEWATALKDVTDSGIINTAEYLLAHPLAADFLEEGLAQFGSSCQE